MSSVIEPEVLIISNTHDYSTDHVTYQLSQRGTAYLRLNRDQFSEMQLSLSLDPPMLVGQWDDLQFRVSDSHLKSVYFRAPVFLRENNDAVSSPDHQLSRSQWSAFLRSLTVFSNARWINHPAATYQAEVKPFQLLQAANAGFLIPKTIVTNHATGTKRNVIGETVVIKTLDSAVFKLGDEEGFIYTNIVNATELWSGDISTAPIIVQEHLAPKRDIRVTVVGQSVFPVEITDLDGHGFENDWRLNKGRIQYTECSLPDEVAQRCVGLVESLGLTLGGIDLVECMGEYVFIEVNPTGEWAWLLSHTGLAIDEAIADQLLGTVSVV